MIKSLSYVKKARITGNMFVVSIPKDVVEGMDIKEGDLLEVRLMRPENE